jgi:hypothetical protein
MPAIRPSVDLKDNYDAPSGRQELYSLIDDGLKQVEQGKVRPMRDTIQEMRANLVV